MKSTFFLAFVALVALSFGCQNRSSDQFQRLEKDLNDTTSLSDVSGDSVKLVKTADINVKVTNVEQSTRTVSALAHKYGGMVYYQDFKSVEGRSKELKVSDDSLLVISTVTP